MDNAIQTQVQEDLQEESSWEVHTDESDEDFSDTSEESSDEELGDEVHRRRRKQRTAIP